MYFTGVSALRAATSATGVAAGRIDGLERDFLSSYRGRFEGAGLSWMICERRKLPTRPMKLRVGIRVQSEMEKEVFILSS